MSARKFDIEENLAKSYKLTYPNASREELYYVSDFQTFADLPEMPERAKEWLLTNVRVWGKTINKSQRNKNNCLHFLT